MKALDWVKSEACQLVAPNQNSILTPPSDLRGTRDGQAWELSASCQRLLFQNVSVTVRRPGREALLLGGVPLLHVLSRPQDSCPLSSFRPHGRPPAPSGCGLTGAQVPNSHCPPTARALPTALSLQLCPQQDTAAARLTTVSLRCGHLLLGGFPFFISLDNAFFQD